MKRLLHFSLILLALTLAASCASQKRKGPRKGIGKAYNNVTARNNGYFNAKVLLTESIAKLEEQHRDNYNKLLPVYPYLAASNPQDVAGDLDEAIKKVSVVVTLHRGSHWDDDCYLLLAQAQHIKQDFEDAENSFNYAAEQYHPDAIAEREAELARKGKKGKKRRKASKKKNKKRKKASSKKRKKSAKQRKKDAKKRKKERERERKEARKNKGKKKSNSKKPKQPKASGKEVTKPKKVGPKAVTVSNEEKKKEKPDKYILKHRPAYQEIRLWQAINLIERDDYDQASSIMAELEGDSKTFPYILREVAPARAHFYIKQNRFDDAILYLEKAIELGNDKKKKARYAYIIAQIHQEAGRTDQAFAFYDQALKYSASYDMEFSSRLNLTQSAWKKGEASPEEVLKDLKKMLKDIKNEGYEDQIYFVMADVALSVNDQENAIEYLIQSIDLNTSNEPQKVESNYKLAILYFEREEYIEAEEYFGNTLSIMPNTDERYPVVKNYKDNLKDIAENLKTIKLQDSLLRLSALSDEEKLAMASKMKKKQEEDRINKLKEQSQKAINTRRANNSRRRTTTAPSSFFAYDDKKVKRGKKDFSRKWGDRPLKDNWRRSSSQELQEGNVDVASEEKSLQLTMDEVKKILGDIPDDQQAKDVANEKIEKALYKLGILYRDRLENPKKSIATFEELLQRYPDTEYRMEAWYYLYLAHTQLSETAKANQYKDLIVKNYAGSKYARALTDPDFLNANKEEERRLILYYNEAYGYYDQGQFKKAYNHAIKADSLFGPGNQLKPRFALLSAICVGSIKGKKAYTDALKLVIAKYPDTPEQIRAKEILRLLGGAPKEKKNLAKSKFRLNDKSSHYLIIMLDKSSVKTEDAKIAVSNYNLANHKLDRIKITTITLGENLDQPALVLRRYKNRADVMKYYDGVQKNKKDFMPARAKYELYPITQSNYRQILRAKSLDGYPAFFEDNYLD